MISPISLGHDVVHIPGFAEQLGRPGSTFESVFSSYELRMAATKTQRGPRGRAEHLAGRWAAKEAFIKAWSQALFGQPPALSPEEVDWSEIEIRTDHWGRVALELSGKIATAVEVSVGAVSTALSISHDGDYASATVILQRYQLRGSGGGDAE